MRKARYFLDRDRHRIAGIHRSKRGKGAAGIGKPSRVQEPLPGQKLERRFRASRIRRQRRKLRRGVGGALVLEGKVFRGTRGFAGEIGHICLDPQGPFCTCGSRGCFEQYTSASAIERSYLEKCAKRATGPAEPTGAESVTAELVFQRACEEDSCAIEVVRETAQHIARVFGNLVNVFNPEACIIGGGISAAGEELLEPVTEYIADFAWPLPLSGVKIHTAALQNEAGILGAAAQCLEHLDL